MKKLALLLPLLGILTSCKPPLTREQQLSIYRSRCLDYGYQMGTLEFSDCMMKQEARAEELAIQARKVDILKEQNWLERQRIEVKRKEIQAQKDKAKRKRKESEKL